MLSFHAAIMSQPSPAFPTHHQWLEDPPEFLATHYHENKHILHISTQTNPENTKEMVWVAVAERVGLLV